jgi:hypothetical protein
LHPKSKIRSSGAAFTDPGVDAYEQRYQERIVKNLKKKAHALGFDLVPQLAIEPEQCAS